MKHVTQSTRYALAGLAPIRYVVTKLEGAGDRPLSLDTLAFAYDHFVPGDYHRVKLHEGCANDHAAKRWLIEYAVSELGDDIIEVVGGDDDPSYRLKVPLEEVIYQRRRVMPYVAQQTQFSGGSDPFSPVNGIFTANLRDRSEDDDLDELIASMREFGWVEHFPAIRDERDVVLVGHRRLKVAAELGIEPVWLEIELGLGTVADAERLKLALVSNIGFRQMTPTSRKRIAKYLYGDVGWSMEKIAAALRVNHATISRDTEGICAARTNSSGSPGVGRPRLTDAERAERAAEKAAKKAAKEAATMPPREIVDEIFRLITAGELVNVAALTRQFDTNRAAVRAAQTAAQAKWEMLQEIQQEKEAAVTPVGTIPGLAQRLADLAQLEPKPIAQTEPEPAAQTEPEPAAQTEPEPETTEHVHLWVCSCGARMGGR